MTHSDIRYERLIEDLSSEFRPQREWAEGRGFFLIVGHFLVGVAAGAWLFGMYFGNLDSLFAAFVLGGLGGLAHLVNLARPERFYRMMSQIGTSWVARGFWGLTFFLLGGVLYLPAEIPALAPWGATSVPASIGLALSVAGSIILIGYMGFVYSASKGIPFWNSALHPVLYVAYAARGGAAAVLVALAVRGETAAPLLLQIWIGITAVVILLWLIEIQSASSSRDEAAQKSVHDILAGRLALYFYGGTLVVGFAVPVLLISGAALPLSSWSLAVVGLTSVAGDFFMKFSSIKAGVYLPVRLPHRRQTP